MNRYVIINAPKTPSVIDVKDAKIFKTEYAGHAIDMIREICASDPSAEIHVYGGDGSVFESINAVMTAGCATETVMYIHPFGTGNDFVRNFSEDQYNQPRTIDLIRFNEKYAANEINVGFDCDVVCMTQKVKKTKIFKGSAAYMVSVFLSLLKPMGKNAALFKNLLSAQGKRLSYTHRLLRKLRERGKSAPSKLERIKNGAGNFR